MEYGPSPLAHHKDVLETFVASVGVTALGKGPLTYYVPRDRTDQQVCVDEAPKPADEGACAAVGDTTEPRSSLAWMLPMTFMSWSCTPSRNAAT